MVRFRNFCNFVLFPFKNPTVLPYAITIKDVINQQKKYVKK